MSSDFITVEMPGTDPALGSTLNAYREYQTAKAIRQALTARLAMLLLGIGILTLYLHLLPTAALLTTSAIASALFLIAGSNEWKARRRLAAQLNGSRR
jgi:hypothetical protein